MSDPEQDSRSAAVGRKRKFPGKYALSSTAADRAGGGASSSSKRSSSKETTSRRSSLESGEIVSAGEGRSPSPDEWDNKYGRNFIPINFKVPKPRTLSTSTNRSALEEYRSSPKMPSTAESETDKGVTDLPRAMASSTTATRGTRICQLSHKEIEQQEIYFGLYDPDDLCYCMCCGGRGHMASICPKSTCEHCGAKQAHASWACPIYRKCRLCRKRGHSASECTNPAIISDADPCDICQEAGHVEEECPRLWSVSLEPDKTVKIRKIPDRDMIRACYSCGSDHHWGDDCPYRDRNMPPNLVKTWSKAFADQFVMSPRETVEQSSRTKDDRPAQAVPTW